MLSSGFRVLAESGSEFPVEELFPWVPIESGIQPARRKLMIITIIKLDQRQLKIVLTCHHLLLYKNQQSL